MSERYVVILQFLPTERAALGSTLDKLLVALKVQSMLAAQVSHVSP